MNFTSLMLTLKEGEDGKPPVAIHYGNFLQAVVDFLIVAFCIFLMVKGINRLKREEPKAPPPPAEPPKQEVLLAEIRDAVKDLARVEGGRN
jgi:large conductance mechanosensitive channel